MLSELDRKYDEAVATITGEGGRIQVGRDPESGLPIVTNLPPTLPTLFDIFCALHGDMEAIVAGEERLSFAELNRQATRLARALVARGVRKGDRVGIAMRNCPSWIVSWMAILKAGGIATLLNGWWRGEEMRHAMGLASPSLVIADPPRGERLQANCTVPLAILPIEQPIAEAIAPLVEGEAEADLPIVLPNDDATILFTSGSTGLAKGAVSTHRAVTTAVYAYALGLSALRGIKEASGETVPPPRILVSVPLFHVTGEVPVLLNSFVVGRTMVLMPKWDPEEALRLIEKERITYFVGTPTK
jgi:long-chain acyl-CoA synthetase